MLLNPMVTIRTRESTKEKLAENVSIISVTQKEYCLQQSRTYRQAKRIMENLGLTPGSSEKSVNDPLTLPQDHSLIVDATALHGLVY